jgi:hypothetical protein
MRIIWSPDSALDIDRLTDQLFGGESKSASASFLKKRNKKLLAQTGPCWFHSLRPILQKFFGYFFSKK